MATSKSVFTGGTLHARQDALRKVHFVQALPPLLETRCTVRKKVEVPQVGEDALPLQAQAVIQNVFERGESGGENSWAARASRAPLPSRVGITQATFTPASNANRSSASPTSLHLLPL